MERMPHVVSQGTDRAGLTAPIAVGPASRIEELEAGLRRHNAILAALVFAAERFLGSADWEVSISAVLERLGRAAEVAAIDLVELRGPDPAPDSVRFRWSAPHTV